MSKVLHDGIKVDEARLLPPVDVEWHTADAREQCFDESAEDFRARVVEELRASFPADAATDAGLVVDAWSVIGSMLAVVQGASVDPGPLLSMQRRLAGGDHERDAANWRKLDGIVTPLAELMTSKGLKPGAGGAGERAKRLGRKLCGAVRDAFPCGDFDGLTEDHCEGALFALTSKRGRPGVSGAIASLLLESGAERKRSRGELVGAINGELRRARKRTQAQ
jgi:hypothetical protein